MKTTSVNPITQEQSSNSSDVTWKQKQLQKEN